MKVASSNADTGDTTLVWILDQTNRQTNDLLKVLHSNHTGQPVLINIFPLYTDQMVTMNSSKGDKKASKRPQKGHKNILGTT